MSNVVNDLNTLLADSTVLYQKLRSMHWVVKGPMFFALHIKFEELYNAWATYIDDIAERILTIGGTPHTTLSTMIAEARLSEFSGHPNAREMVATLQADLKTIIESAGSVMAKAEEAGDTGTI
jgi:starvation-inducible DNA-binding protein